MAFYKLAVLDPKDDSVLACFTVNSDLHGVVKTCSIDTEQALFLQWSAVARNLARDIRHREGRPLGYEPCRSK